MSRKQRQGTRHRLEGGTIAFCWNGCGDVRGYVPPKGFAAVADLIERHPATGEFLGESQWWMFLKPKGGKA
jgi:hypothetical protein